MYCSRHQGCHPEAHCTVIVRISARSAASRMRASAGANASELYRRMPQLCGSGSGVGASCIAAGRVSLALCAGRATVLAVRHNLQAGSPALSRHVPAVASGPPAGPLPCARPMGTRGRGALRFVGVRPSCRPRALMQAGSPGPAGPFPSKWCPVADAPCTVASSGLRTWRRGTRGRLLGSRSAPLFHSVVPPCATMAAAQRVVNASRCGAA